MTFGGVAEFAFNFKPMPPATQEDFLLVLQQSHRCPDECPIRAFQVMELSVMAAIVGDSNEFGMSARDFAVMLDHQIPFDSANHER